MAPLEEARQIVAAATNADLAAIESDASIHNLPTWDSIAHVNIMLAIEERSGAPLPVNAVVGITSVSAIADFLQSLGRS